jgi:hypothetical protein
MTPTINQLRALAEKATQGGHEGAEAHIGMLAIVSQPEAILALLDRLEAAERVVEAARKVKDYPGHLLSARCDVIEALAEYDRVCGGEKP